MKLKRVLNIFLTIAMMTCTLAGCGGQDAPSSSAEDGKDTDAGQDESTSAPAENTEEPDVAGSDSGESPEPVTFTMYIDIPWFWVDTWGEDPISQKITEQTGVSFEITRAADSQQIALMIAGGDLPDFVYTDNAATVNAMSAADVSYSYNELVDQYGVDIHATETEIADNTAPDGNYYALTNAYTTKEALEAGTGFRNGGASSVAYRTDLYEELGSPKLETLEDLEQVLLAAKEKYPDIIPLATYGTEHFMKYFIGQMGIKAYSTTSAGYNSENKPCYALHAEGIKEYYELLNRYAREGLINAEVLTYDDNRYNELINSGNAFMSVLHAAVAMSANSANKENGGQGYEWKLIVKDLGENALPEVGIGIGWARTFITKENHDPQKAIEFMSWCRSEEARKLCSWGIQGEHWDYDSQGRTVTTESYRAALAEGKSKQADFGIGMWIFGDQGDENAFMDYATDDQDQLDYYDRIKEVSSHTVTYPELYKCVPQEGDMLNIWNALGDMVSTEMMNVIFAESDAEFEAAYESMQSQATALGIDTLEEWMAEQLAD